jgi:hypothetical protein
VLPRTGATQINQYQIKERPTHQENSKKATTNKPKSNQEKTNQKSPTKKQKTGATSHQPRRAARITNNTQPGRAPQLLLPTEPTLYNEKFHRISADRHQ